MPWRWAIGMMLIMPSVCFILLIFCPESPVWYLSKERESDARNSLEKLRGKENSDLIEAEFNRILLNIKEKEKSLDNENKGLWEKIPKDGTFWKPFGILFLMMPLGD